MHVYSLIERILNIIQVFDSKGRLLHFMDGGHVSPASWLSLIQCARLEREQNLEVIQIGSDLYFKASKVS